MIANRLPPTDKPRNETELKNKGSNSLTAPDVGTQLLENEVFAICDNFERKSSRRET